MKFYEYFGADKCGFWQWEEQGTVIAVPNGPTIAYRDQVAPMLDLLADQGLPSFDTLLLVLLATNPDGANAVEILPSVWQQAGAPAGLLELTVNELGFLQRLAGLPRSYKTGQKRLLLIQTVLANTHNGVGPKEARQLADQFRLRQYELPELLKKRGRGEQTDMWSAYHARNVLRVLNSRFPTEESILSKLTDLPTLPEPILPAEPAPVGPTDFVQSLLDDSQTFEVGALVKRLWSGLAIPFRQSQPTQRPVGGVSDLTNKGQLHHLLLSEWANDDLVFLSRLANDEALYLNREIPPTSDTRDRVLLLDVSLKNWGTPKTLAFALAVALAHHPKANARTLAFTVGHDCQSVDLGERDGLIAGLQRLTGGLHAATGLADYFRNHAPAGSVELFWVSTARAVQAPAMQQAMSQYGANFSYYLFPNSTGQIALYRQQGGGRKHLQDLTLPLAELWKNKPKAAKEPPVIEEERPEFTYPILFPMRNGQGQALVNAFRDRSKNVLKSVKVVFVNQHNQLMLNVHELVCLQNPMIKLKLNKQAERQRQAVGLPSGVFRFPDGSMVYVNRDGMLMLVSSDTTLPTIYVPLVLDSALGLATDAHFAGDERFRLPQDGQDSLSIRDFWQQYIVKFIQTITEHGSTA